MKNKQGGPPKRAGSGDRAGQKPPITPKKEDIRDNNHDLKLIMPDTDILGMEKPARETLTERNPRPSHTQKAPKNPELKP